MIVACHYCDSLFHTKPSRLARSDKSFCSRLCFSEYKKTPAVQFWRHVKKGADNECWLWLGTIDKDGYGRAGVNIGAHRMSYEIHKGPIPYNLKIRHSCHNPPCVNPNHLSVGTTLDNSTDMVEAGRSLAGARNPRSKLSQEDVDTMRSLYTRKYSRGGVTLQFLADTFGVSKSEVGKIVRGGLWKKQ